MLSILLSAIYYLLYAISLMVFIRAVFSFFGNARFSRFYAVLERLTEPFLEPLRQLISKFTKGRPITFDFSYIALYVIVMLLQRIIIIIQSYL